MANIEGENAAARIVAAVLGGVDDRRDGPGAPPGTHDFDVLLPKGKVAALEITTAAYTPFFNLWASLEKKRPAWTTGKLRLTWFISLSGPVDEIPVNDLARDLERLLAVLEDHKCEGFDRVAPDAIQINVTGVPPPALKEAVRSLQVLRVAACASDSSGQVPCVIFGHTSTGGFVSPNGVNLVVEACVRENLSKLQAAEADERHLFVWIDPSIGVAGVGITSDCPPVLPPLFDSEVTAIWVGFPAPGGAAAGASRLWRATTAGWLDLGGQLVESVAKG